MSSYFCPACPRTTVFTGVALASKQSRAKTACKPSPVQLRDRHPHDGFLPPHGATQDELPNAGVSCRTMGRWGLAAMQRGLVAAQPDGVLPPYSEVSSPHDKIAPCAKTCAKWSTRAKGYLPGLEYPTSVCELTTSLQTDNNTLCHSWCCYQRWSGNIAGTRSNVTR